jgi:hypothetical protein
MATLLALQSIVEAEYDDRLLLLDRDIAQQSKALGHGPSRCDRVACGPDAAAACPAAPSAFAKTPR